MTDLAQLLAAEKAVRPSPELAQRGLTRLLESVAAAPLPVAAAASTSAGKFGWTVASKWIVGGFALGLVGSSVSATLSAPRRAPRAQPTAAEAARAAAVTSAAALPALPVATPPAPEPSAVAPTTPTTRAPRATSATLAPSTSVAPTTFDAELHLINAAKGQLDAGQPHLAKVWLDEHAARYPNGVFTTDREALRVLAACAEHRDPALAAHFVASHPTSALRERLTGACEPRLNSK